MSVKRCVHVGCMRVRADWAGESVFARERGFLNPSVITVYGRRGQLPQDVEERAETV